jgi:5-methylcytosine-specific restriction endonuclease McrA
MLCEKCLVNINGLYGSGRFCGPKCSRSFSTQNKRTEINKKISKKLAGRKYPGRGNRNRVFTNVDRLKATATKKLKREARYGLMSFLELPRIQKRLIIFNEQSKSCLHCNLDKWLDEPITLKLDHINGNNKDNKRENLRLLCPNCHSKTPTWRKGSGIIVASDQEIISVANNSSSINEILKHFELPWGSNRRIKRVLIKHNLANRFV